MKYVGVRHQNNQQTTYWFEVSDELAPHIHIGSEVLCHTRRGDNLGTVISVLEGISQEQARNIIGNFFPLSNIIGVSMDAELEAIHIPWDMEFSTPPEPEEIAAQITAFYDNGKFSTPVVFTQDMNLHNGYAAYLVARMLGHEKLHGFCMKL